MKTDDSLASQLAYGGFTPQGELYLRGRGLTAAFEFRGFATHSPEAMAAGNLACHRLFADGRLRPHIGAVYPLARVADALDDVLHRRATGKLVIDPTAG